MITVSILVFGLLLNIIGNLIHDNTKIPSDWGDNCIMAGNLIIVIFLIWISIKVLSIKV